MDKSWSIYARSFIGLVSILGLLALAVFLVEPFGGLPARFLCYFLLALLSSGLKVSLPGRTGTLSISFVFILTAIVELGLPQAMLLGLCCAGVQIFWLAKRRAPLIQVVFNLAVIAVSISISHMAFHSALAGLLGGSLPVRLLLATAGYYTANSLPIGYAIALTERRRLVEIWREYCFWAFPYYLLGATVVCLIDWTDRNLGWEFSLLVMPAGWVVYHSYCLYIGRLETEKAHVEQMNGLHLRTIEALTLAIEAKDHSTTAHLRRVQHYAVEIGKEMGLSQPELDALRAASLLHDIGKLAIPEHIISKPGKLTSQEFQKMKIHPVVGAEILEQVDFPYPVAPIVRAHHEKWDGSGYPYGIAGEAIPLAARILAAIDCLDALASERQYRRALPLDRAMEMVREESGKSYDPKVVEILSRRYLELEETMCAATASTKLPGRAKIAPAAGSEAGTRVAPGDFLQQIAAAGREAQCTLELVTDLGNSLSLSETLSVLSARLTLIPCDTVAVYECNEERLVPVYVEGRERMLFSSLEIPLGEGLTGWVARKDASIFNGNPSVELGYLNDPSKFSQMRSALAVPLKGLNRIVGVLSLYRSGENAFSQDDLRILTGISAKIGLSFENALKYRAMEASATTDYLTGLNNARSLFERLHQELSECRRHEVPLTVLVCDLDGFKQVNDRFGHVAGNSVLQVFAKGLEKIVRGHDSVARLGGDEFVLVLPGMRRESIGDTIDRLEALANAAGRQVCGENILSVSVGGACYPEDGSVADGLLDEADRRMYDCKKAHKAASQDLRAEQAHLQPV